MPIDFPTAPTDGQVHSEQGQVWTWDATNSCWQIGAVTGDVQTIFDGAVNSNGWAVMGDLLLQWGEVTTETNGSTVTFSVAYETGPRVQLTVRKTTDPFDRIAVLNASPTTNNFSVLGMSSSGVNQATNVQWLAMGLAPVALRTTKVVYGGGEPTP